MFFETFKIGFLTFSIHGIFAGLGLIFGATMAYLLSPKTIRPKIFDYIFIVSLAGLVGARLSYALIYHGQFSSFLSVFSATSGGFISYGGMIFGAGSLYLFLCWQKENYKKIFDAVSLAFFFGLGTGRVGEIFAKEFSGKVVTSKIAQAYLSTGVFATPVFEAVLCLVLFIVGLIIFRSKKYQSGHLTLLLILIYSYVRFFIDFGRIENKLMLNLSAGQICGLALFIFSAILLIRDVKNESRKE